MATTDPTAAPERADRQGLTLADRPARIEQLRESIARRALAGLGTPDVRILQIVRTGPILTVATEQPNEYFTYAVDSFRLPVPDETDPDQDDPRGLCDWVIADQYGGFAADEVDGMMARALTYAVLLRDWVVTA